MIPVFMGEIWILMIVGLMILFVVRSLFASREAVLKAVILGLIWVPFNLIIEWIGVSQGWWAPKESLFFLGGHAAIELAPICFFGGAFWILEFDSIKLIKYKSGWFVLTAVTGGYVTALLIYVFEWMEHFGWWNISWTFFFYSGIFGFLVFTAVVYDIIVSKKPMLPRM